MHIILHIRLTKEKVVHLHKHVLILYIILLNFNIFHYLQEELRFQYGVTGGEAKKKALAYIYKCKGTLPQFSSMFEPNKYILTNFSFLGVRDVSLENCILIVRGEGLDEDKMRRKMDKILSSNPGCLSCFSSSGWCWSHISTSIWILTYKFVLFTCVFMFKKLYWIPLLEVIGFCILIDFKI